MEQIILSLLESKYTVILEILEIISTEDRWYSVCEVADRLDVSSRTIQRQFNILFEIVNKNIKNQDKLILLVKKNKGIYLKNINGNSRSLIISELFNSDENLKILKLIFLDSFPSVARYAEKNFLSTTKVRATINKINDLLKEYKISYSVFTKKINGKEKEIRVIIYSFFWFIFKNQKWPEEFNGIDEVKIEKVVSEFTNRLGINSNSLVKKRLAFILAVSILRIRKNNKIKFQQEWIQYLPYKLNNNLITAVEDMFAAFCIYDEDEILFMSLNCLMTQYIYESKELRNIVIEGNNKNATDVYKKTNLFLNVFSEKILKVPEDKYSDVFIQAFKIHLSIKIFDSIKNAYSEYYFLKEEYPQIYKKLELLVDYLYKLTEDDCFLKKEFLIQQYMIIFASIMPISYFEKKIKVILATDLPKLLENSIQKYLKDKFTHQYNVEFIDCNSFQNPDIIITNFLDNIKAKENVNFIFPINKRMLKEIEAAIKKVMY